MIDEIKVVTLKLILNIFVPRKFITIPGKDDNDDDKPYFSWQALAAG